MRRNFNWLCYVFLVLTITFYNNALAETTEFLTHSVEGKVYIDEHGELRGLKHGGRRAFNVELVREMMLLVDHKVQFQIVPFARGQLALKKKSVI